MLLCDAHECSVLWSLGLGSKNETFVRATYDTDETKTDAELARVSVLILDVTKTAYVSPVAKRLASVMKNFNKKIDRKNLNFVNKTAI